MTDLIGKELADLGTSRGFVHEFHEWAFPTIKYFPLSTDVPSDSLYSETIEKTFGASVDVPAYFRTDPSTKILARYGIESWQPAIAVMDNITLSRLQIDPKPGDRIEYFGMLYEVLTVKYTDYWVNTQYPLSRVLTLKNLNEG